MSIDDFPIIVAKFDATHPSDLAVCADCGAEFTFNPQDGDPFDRCLKHIGCGGQIVFKYDEGETCVNCRALAIRHPWKARDLGPACSRACALQAEYAKSRKETV